jgi:hypothetical protein
VHVFQYSSSYIITSVNDRLPPHIIAQARLVWIDRQAPHAQNTHTAVAGGGGRWRAVAGAHVIPTRVMGRCA